MKKYVLTENQIKKIVDTILVEQGEKRKKRASKYELNEQVPPEDDEDILIPRPEDYEDGVSNEYYDDETRPGDQEHPTEPHQKHPKPKKESPYDKIKKTWLTENPYLTNEVMDGVIEFFNNRKNGLRIYMSTEQNPNYVNLPEITALLLRFPEMMPILTNIQKIRDIQNYTWDQMEFFMDRLGTTQVAPIMDFQLEGYTFERKLQSAYEKWNKTENRIVDEDNIRVFKITGTDEAIALGRLQRLLVDAYGGVYWCVTHAQGESQNLYSNYRPYSVYYFVLNKNLPEGDKYYISSINACDMNSVSGRNNGPYFITPRPNGSETQKTWNDICNIGGFESLRNKEHLFKYFGLTSKERASALLDRINFRKNDSFYFGIQNVSLQKQYIENNRLINDAEAFGTLPYNTKDKNDDLRLLYINHTNLEDWNRRYLSTDNSRPFAMLNKIQKETPQHFKKLQYNLTEILHIPSGILGIKLNIIGSSYIPIFIDNEKKYVCFRERSGINHGVMNLENIEWIKQLDRNYVRTTPLLAIRNNGQYIFQRFASNDGEDYFYFVFTFNDYYNKKSPTRGQGKFYDGKDGDNLFNNGEFRKLDYRRT